MPSFEAETKALFNYPSQQGARLDSQVAAGFQARSSRGYLRMGQLGLEHRCSGGSAHPGAAPVGKLDLRVGGPCVLGPTHRRI